MSRQHIAIAVVAVTLVAPTVYASPITNIADPALSGATLESFDSAPLAVLTNLVLGGVTVSSTLDFAIGEGSIGDYTPPNPAGDRFLRNTNPTLSTQVVQFTFASPVSAFGLQVGAVNGGATLVAYGALNNVIESLVIPDQVGTLPPPYTGFYGISGTDIVRFTITLNNDIAIMDDLRYVTTTTATPVPEPASMTLFGIGLAGLGARRWRQRRNP